MTDINEKVIGLADCPICGGGVPECEMCDGDGFITVEDHTEDEEA